LKNKGLPNVFSAFEIKKQGIWKQTQWHPFETNEKRLETDFCKSIVNLKRLRFFLCFNRKAPKTSSNRYTDCYSRFAEKYH